MPSTIGRLLKLRYLSLDNTKITGTLPASMSKLQSLHELHLRNTLMAGLELGTLYGFKSSVLNSLCSRGCAIEI